MNQTKVALLVVLLSFSFFPAEGSAAVISSTQTGGNWSDSATWQEDIVPSDGDQAIIFGPVNITSDTTIGTSAASGNINAVQVMGGGGLTIGTDVKLISRGNIWVSSALLMLHPGAVIEFDGSINGGAYELNLAQTGAKLQINGSSEKTCKILSNERGPNAYIYDGNAKGSICATYCDFIRLGRTDPSFPSLWWTPGDETEIRLDHCEFQGCAFLYIYQPSASSVLQIENCTWDSSTMDKCVRIDSITAKTAGSRFFRNCWFDSAFVLNASQDVTFEGNVFYGGIRNSGYGKRWALFDSNLVRLPGTDGSTTMLADGHMSNIYFLHDSEGLPVNNPHYCYVAKNLSGEFIIDGCIFEAPFYNSDSDIGDCILVDSGSTQQTVTMRHCIGLPVKPTYTGHEKNSPGTAFSIFSSASKIDFKFEKNTFYGGSPHGICTMGEGVMPFSGKISLFRDNMLWDNTETGSERAYAVSTDATDAENRFFSESATNNGWWSLKKTDIQPGMSSQGTIYNVPTTGIVPGANDINASPQFLDSTRNFASWAVMLGSKETDEPGQIADGLSYLKGDLELLTREKTGLLPWVRQGFLPTNTVFMGKASDGTIIGAIPYGYVYVNKYDSTCGGNNPCYESLQSGMNAASTGCTIMIRAGNYEEIINMNSSKNLTLEGGWNESFTYQSPNKTKIKAPRVNEGASLTMKMLTIMP